jgi:5'-3' exonuclease
VVARESLSSQGYAIGRPAFTVGGMSAACLLALDGTNLLYRSFHALAGSGLSYAGRPVWAVHGLVLQIAKLVEAVRPTHLLVAFDTRHGCAWRREIDPGYKATRSAPVPDLAQQLSWAPSALRQAGLLVNDDPEHEADDILASAVTIASSQGMRSVVATSDRDAYQLLSPLVSVRTPENKVVTVETLEQLHGVSPSGYALLAALRGEPSDNLPGVRGVGGKTAARLVQEFGSFERLEAAADADLRKVLGPKGIESLRRDLPLARRSARVATLRRDLPLPIESGLLARLDPSAAERALVTVGLAAAGRRLAASLAASRPV